jgi:hypothetical protein
MIRNIFLLFFVILIGAGAFAFYIFEKKELPRDVVQLEILGPKEAEMLEDIEYTVVYKNKGETLLEDVALIFEYPEGAVPQEERTKLVRKTIGDLLPGQEQSSRFPVQLLGKEKETKTVQAKVEYKPKGLQAFFETTTSFTTTIKTVPFSLEFDLPSKVGSGDVTFSISYRSFSRDPITNLNVRVDYPIGFDFERSQPLGLTPDEWRIGLLNRGEGGRIDISGALKGSEFEQKIFKAEVIVFNEIEQKPIVIKEVSRGVEVTNPSIFISQWVNGRQGYIANPWEELHFEIFFRNTSETIQKDLLLLVELDTKAVDINTVRVPLGSWKKESKIILWDSRTLPELRVLGPYSEGKAEFWVNTKDVFGDLKPDDRNLMIISRVTAGQEKEEFRIPVNSKIELTQGVYYTIPPEVTAYLPVSSDGQKPQNKGPVPPVAKEKTTYTVMWSLKNYFNDLANAKVRVSLPPHARILEQEGDFRQEGQEVIWDLGTVASYQGVYSSPLVRVFQIEVEPPISSVGKPLILIDGIKFDGEDLFTKSFLNEEKSFVDSLLPDDPSNGGVVKPAIESRVE